MKGPVLALVAATLLGACSLSFLNIERPLRGELPSGTEDIPIGRVFAVQGSTLHVLQVLREGDQIRITRARSIDMFGGSNADFAQSLMTDPERVFRLTSGADNTLIQLTLADGGNARHSGLFGRRRCHGDLCIVELRDVGQWQVTDAASMGYIHGNGGIVCVAEDPGVSGCTLSDPVAFARSAAQLDHSNLLRGNPVAFLVPSQHQP